MLFVSGILLLFGLQGELNQYRLEIDPVLLDSLYSYPYADYHFPASIETEAGSCSCLAGFRGSTSLGLPKKSWEIELYDHSLINASHILLDAQYRDLTLMRNALGLFLTRQLGRPASMVEHVELYVNSEYYGVYVQVERVDEYFYNRNGLGYGPLFKSVNHLGRFAWQPSDILGTTGFEAKQGSEGYLPLILQLIDAVNLFSPLTFDLDDYLAYAAVTLAIRDTDALTKNFYIHFTPEEEWRLYPWDRDATFGNDWTGEYVPWWTEQKSLYGFERSSLTTRLLMQYDNRNLFDEYLLLSGEIMIEELPFIIDSIYFEIRESVYADSFKQGTNDDFDEAVTVLREAVIERGQYIPGIAGGYKPLSVESMVLSKWDFETEGNSDSVTVTIEFSEPATYALLCYWNDGEDLNSIDMNQDDLYGNIWSQTVLFPEAYEKMLFSVGSKAQIASGTSNSSSYYPLYGPPSLPSMRVSAPSARRSSWQLNPDELEVLSPVRYTTSLWSIPVVNISTAPQDISFCGFQIGSPPARLHTGADVLIMPGDTVYLTNSKAVLEVILNSSSIQGDLVIDSPANTQFLFLYPSWETAIDTILGDEISFHQSGIVLNELMSNNDTSFADNYGDFDDWIEITNNGPVDVNLSGYYLSDDTENPFIFAFPDTVIQPGEYFIVWADDEPFQGPMHAEFKLSSSGESIFLLYSLLLVDEIAFSELDEDISFGRWPNGSGDWEILSISTPGAPNEGGTGITSPDILALRILAPNPFCGSRALTIQGNQGLARLDVYDLSGRLMDTPFNGEIISSESFSWDVSSLATGVYFLRLTQGDETTIQKVTVIK